MSNEAFKSFALLAGLAVLYKVADHQFSIGDFSFYFFLLLLLVGVFQGLRINYNSQEPQEFLELFKQALQIPILLCVFIGLLGYIYLSSINPDFLPNLIEGRISEGRELGYSEENLVKLRNNLSAVFNPAVYSTLSFFGLMIMTIVYTVVSTFLFRKIKVFRTI